MIIDILTESEALWLCFLFFYDLVYGIIKSHE